MKLSAREVATILAALRLWQRGDAIGDDGDEELADIASNGETYAPLNHYEIDALCERINFNENP